MYRISRSTTQSGYVLIATILLGLAIAIASSTFLQYVVNSSTQLTNDTYNRLADEAAEAGAVYAADCIGQYSGNWTVLRPNTTCDGATQGSQYVSTSKSGIFTWNSAFSVAPYAETADNYKLTVTGTLDIFRGTTKIQTYTVTKTSLLSKQVLLASTTPATEQQATALSVDTHACAIADGKLYCWGDNSRGQIGDGTTTDRGTATLVAATNVGDAFYGKKVTRVAVGSKDTCAIADGVLYCWGDNTYGQVGMNNIVTTMYSTPRAVLMTNVAGSKKVTDLSLSQATTTPGSACIVVDGLGYCWGRNDQQQLGFGNTNPAYIPTAVNTSGILSGRKITRISVGDTNGCALAIGYLVCWGGGQSPTWINAYPYNGFSDNLAVTGKTLCSAVTAYYHALSCYGQSNALPALSTATTAPNFFFNGVPLARAGDATHPLPAPYYRPYEYDGVPFPITGAPDSGISAGNELLCTMAYSRPWCAGTANTGALYAGTPFAMLDSPELNNNNTSGWGYFHSTSVVGVSGNYGCLLANGSIFCWGSDVNGTLGAATASTPATFPLRVAQGQIGGQVNLSSGTSLDTNDYRWTFTADGPLAMGPRHSCAIVNAYIMCWGGNSRGELGTGNTTDNYQPATSAVVLQYGADKIGAGGDSSCVPAPGQSCGDTTCSVSQGKLFCWGDNTYGQLGVDPATTSFKVAPVEVSYFSSNGLYVTDVSVGATNVCAIAGNAQVYCWGKNDQRQVGASGATASVVTTPTAITGGPAGGNATAISVGYSHACAIVNSNLYCWGSNGSYELANTTVGSQYPIQVATSGAFTGVAAGRNFTCAILNGTVSCWGANNVGQLAAAVVARRSTVGAISGTAGSMLATSIAAGDTHACAVLQGATYCWGKNDFGQIGNGTTSASTPVTTPYPVGGSTAIGVGAGGSTSCNVANGLINCWGSNSKMQAGSPTPGGSVTSPLTTQWYRYELNKNKGIFY